MITIMIELLCAPNESYKFYYHALLRTIIFSTVWRQQQQQQGQQQQQNLFFSAIIKICLEMSNKLWEKQKPFFFCGHTQQYIQSTNNKAKNHILCIQKRVGAWYKLSIVLKSNAATLLFLRESASVWYMVFVFVMHGDICLNSIHKIKWILCVQWRVRYVQYWRSIQCQKLNIWSWANDKHVIWMEWGGTKSVWANEKIAPIIMHIKSKYIV